MTCPWPDDVQHIPHTWRPMPQTAEPDPERARWIELLLRDPEAARRERLELRRRYWQARMRALKARLAAEKEKLAEALHQSTEEDDVPLQMPAAEVWQLRLELLNAMRDLKIAKAMLTDYRRQLRNGRARTNLKT